MIVVKERGNKINITHRTRTYKLNVGGRRGPQGPPGQGVPAGGTTGQVLAKDSNTDYDTEWVNVDVIPDGDDLTAFMVTFSATIVETQPYRDPTSGEIDTFLDGMAKVMAGRSDHGLGTLGFTVTTGFEAETKRPYALIVNEYGTERAWGAYLIDMSQQVNSLIEIPHPVADAQTQYIGLDMWRGNPGSILMVAGAHRLADGGQADVCDFTTNMFYAVGVYFADFGVSQVQPHGFADASAPQFDVIVSSGASNSTTLDYRIADALEDNGFRVGRSWDGSATVLLGTTNTLGVAARASGDVFVHVEINNTIRSSQALRQQFADIMSTVGYHDTHVANAPLLTESRTGQFPSAVGSANSVGSSPYAARSDHIHRLTSNTPSSGEYVKRSISSWISVPASEVASDIGFVAGDYVTKDTLVVNVKDHGALGNGTTDDTDAIQDAIDLASAGDIVFIPPGTYIVDPAVSLHLTSGITFAGAGRLSILKIKDNSDVLNNLVKVENADRVILRDFSIDGNRANQDPSDLVAVHYGVYIASSNDCRVDNVYVYNTTGVGIHVYDSVGTVVSNCESSGNRYHGFECEQDTSTIWKGNRGHSNSRHGIFVSPGEVGGTGSIGNIIDGNSFDNNDSYGIAFGIDAAGLSIGLTKDNVVTNNSVINNAEYGISIFRVDDTLVSNNVVAYNGFFGIYLYRAERNQVIGNRLRNNSQVTNGAYDEILLEGANDGQASQHNLIANNFIYIDGVNKANYAIREGTASDGPNVVKDNYVPNSGVTGRVLIQNVNTAYVLISDTPVENLSSLRTYEDGVAIAPNSALPGSSMGLDAPFGTAALRFINNNTGGNIQFVAPDGNLDVYAGGNNISSFTSTYLSMHSNPIQEVDDPTNAQDAATKNYVDTRTGENFRIVSAAPTTIAEGIATLITNKVEKSGDTMTGSLTIGSAAGDTLTINGTATSNTILRLRDDGTERGAIFSLNGSSVVNFRSQGDMVITAHNGTTPRTITLNGTSATFSSGIVISAGTDTDTFSNTYEVRRSNVATGRVDNNASGMRVQALSNALFLRNPSNVGIVLGTATATFEAGLTYTFMNDVIVNSSTNGLILRSPNNTQWRVQVSDAGALTVTSI